MLNMLYRMNLRITLDNIKRRKRKKEVPAASILS